MNKADEQPTVVEALKPCPEAEAIAQEIADRSPWKKTTDNYARIYQAAYTGAIAAWNTRTTSPPAQDGLVEALEWISKICDEEIPLEYNDAMRKAFQRNIRDAANKALADALENQP